MGKVPWNQRKPRAHREPVPTSGSVNKFSAYLVLGRGFYNAWGGYSDKRVRSNLETAQ